MARHNKIMFRERTKLAKLQKEYEDGLRNGESLKKEAQRIVKNNLANMTTITTLCKTKTINGREAFDVQESLRQIWTKVDNSKFISFVSVREQNKKNVNKSKINVNHKKSNDKVIPSQYVVDVYFCVIHRCAVDDARAPIDAVRLGAQQRPPEDVPANGKEHATRDGAQGRDLASGVIVLPWAAATRLYARWAVALTKGARGSQEAKRSP